MTAKEREVKLRGSFIGPLEKQDERAKRIIN
jgi:hypothetical protein